MDIQLFLLLAHEHAKYLVQSANNLERPPDQFPKDNLKNGK